MRCRALAVRTRAALVGVALVGALDGCGVHAVAPTPQTAAPAARLRVAAAAVPAPTSSSSDAPSGSAAPTWSEIFRHYFAAGTSGGCARSASCHPDGMADAASAYRWLKDRGYIAGTRSPIVSDADSCLRWFGGNMPPRGEPNPRAALDLRAWVEAGALEN